MPTFPEAWSFREGQGLEPYLTRTLLQEPVDPVEDGRDVHPRGVADAGAVHIRHVRVDRQHGVRSTEEGRPARVAEAEAARPATRVQGKSHVLRAMHKLAGDELAGSVHPLARAGPP